MKAYHHTEGTLVPLAWLWPSSRIKNNVRVVLQCKLYGGPVGNKAVQEAAAGRAHERADFGIVVTNNRYTSAAEQLAH
jgi:restriction system protein